MTSTSPARPREERHGDGSRSRQAEAAESCKRLAYQTTLRMCFVPRGRVLFDWDDALSIAQAAAWRAHRRFNPAVGCEWETWIIGQIRHALKEAFRSFNYGAARNRSGVEAPEFVSLNTVVTDDADEARAIRLAETMVDPRDDFSAADTAMECAAVLRVLAWLTPREAAVLRAYYIEGVTLKTIARRLELSESRIHQLRREGLDRASEMLAR